MEDESSQIEAEVQKRLSVALAQQQETFATMMEQAIKNALGGIDQRAAALEEERKRLEVELDAAKELRAKAEREGEKMATESFEKHRREYEEAIRTALLRDLTRLHLEGGKTTSDIMKWLNVERNFVERIKEVVNRVDKFHSKDSPAPKLEGNPRLRFVDEGRSGVIYFESSVGSFDMWWEMGYGALAMVAVPSLNEWELKTGMPREKRLEVLNFIGEEIVRRQTYQGSFIIGDDVITIYSE
ncbi:MAG: hypothetical protein SFV55_10440 [Haliscomenobacter sp.]|uniref:hypothetical protein n=1 Tax=Haliscomenobacter sp. TaxID=2717303 RepID=UPI0029BDAADF|nr:hypothetical protein [Haliscomenobacter sp.]MDX2068835.1 hypothetical protein [Haliscomenobacter sp.]